MSDNLFDHYLRSIADPARPVIEGPDGEVFTHADLIARSGQYANALASLGVRPGDRIAVQVEKSVPALLLYLASLRVGAVFLPLNPAYSPPEIGYFLSDAEPALFFCDPDRAEALASVTGPVRTLTFDATGAGTFAETASHCAEDFQTLPRASSDLAALLYTSGTTGRSKGAMLTHANLTSNARTLIEAWGFGPSDVLIHALPIFHTHGLFVATNVILLSGGRMIFQPGFSPDKIFEALPRATSLMGVPTFYTRLLRDPRLSAGSTRHMRLFISGSAPLLDSTHRDWSARTGHAILERYGMTETNMNSSNPLDGDRVPGTVGLPLPGVEIRITDPATGSLLGTDEIGMVEVRGPNVFAGYWRMPDRTAAEFRTDGFFITGDLGRVDTRGYLSIVGRGKDLVITGGLNVYPKEVETEIDALPGVIESAVIGVPHPDFGEAVVAVIAADPAHAPSAAAILAALRDRLAAFKLPKRLVFVETLPRNTMGKVQKAELRREHTGLFDAPG